MLSNIKKIKTSVSIDPFLAIIAIIGLAFAYYRFGWSILNPKNIGWLLSGGDSAQHFLGWHFFRSEKWYLPPGLFRNYIYPLGTSIGYTD